MSKVFSIRRYLLVNTVLFLVMSVACAFAKNLEQMIILRALQGFHRRPYLIPIAFTLVATTLPQAQRPIGMAELFTRRHLRAGHRPDDRRLADRYLRLAVHFLRQYCPGRLDARDTLLVAQTRADAALKLPRYLDRRLDRHRDLGAWV